VRIKYKDQIFTGHGLATDIVEASARAYIDAMSKIETGDSTTVLAGTTSVSRWS
jgi:hypothetical protein